jgi:gluconokinase
MTIGEYLEMQLFGDTAVTHSAASWSGLLNRRDLTWDQSVLRLLPVVEAQLSPLTEPTACRRGLRRPWARRWPALASVPWFPALGDGAAANLGSGCISRKQVAITIGTTSAVRAAIDGPVPRIPKGLWCYRVDEKRSLVGGALGEGGNVFAWMGASLALGPRRRLERELADMPPCGHGLTVLPLLTGERSPGWACHARATIHGVSLRTRPLELLRAGLEAVACRIAQVVELLLPLIPARPQIVASGGALLASPAWVHMVTDALGRPTTVSRVPEASARGAALLALTSLGAVRDLAEAPPFFGAVVKPDRRAHARYRQAMERQKDLYGRLHLGD